MQIQIVNRGTPFYDNFQLREILDNVYYPEIFLAFLNDKERKKIGSKENAILEFYQQFACVGGDPVFSESLCKELQKKFFQQSSYLY
ncbi:hypothetical protein CASFOL_007686 [Castilleja foliolosa]|uniref:RNA polymerase Rpb2 domain-containing protein n=1 Tax=Castilleja foliolosa TaxID=1961234 RepID=A0ABD3E3B6_9LAMI